MTGRRPLLLAALAGLAPLPLRAQGSSQGAADPAAAVIERLHAKLLEVMRNARSLGIQGRYREMEPVVKASFDLPAMARFAVGSRWSSFSPAEQAQVVEAFTRMSVASYARNFDGFSGQSFVTERVEPRGEERVVVTKLVNPGGAPVDLTYRMQNNGGSWKIVDVLHDQISELTIRRSEFGASIRQGGAPLLVQRIGELSDRLMSGA